jgi:DNA-binding NarL/FixJ family response regulator
LIRLAIIDDHPVFRQGLRRVLERAPDLEVIWESGTVTDLMANLRESPVDVLLLDLYLGPEEDTIAVMRAVRDRYADVRVITISASLDWESVSASRLAGASGYLPKDLSVEDMVAGIRALADPDLGKMPFTARRARPGVSSGNGLGTTTPHAALTRREREVLFEMVCGNSNRDIASHLGISVTTVNKHVHHVLTKLKAKTRAQVIARMRGIPVRNYAGTPSRS